MLEGKFFAAQMLSVSAGTVKNYYGRLVAPIHHGSWIYLVENMKFVHGDMARPIQDEHHFATLDISRIPFKTILYFEHIEDLCDHVLMKLAKNN